VIVTQMIFLLTSESLWVTFSMNVFNGWTIRSKADTHLNITVYAHQPDIIIKTKMRNRYKRLWG